MNFLKRVVSRFEHLVRNRRKRPTPMRVLSPVRSGKILHKMARASHLPRGISVHPNLPPRPGGQDITLLFHNLRDLVPVSHLFRQQVYLQIPLRSPKPSVSSAYQGLRWDKSNREGVVEIDSAQLPKGFSSVNIVNYDSGGWILDRIAERLAEVLSDLGLEVEVSSAPLEGFDVVHHIPFHPVKSKSGRLLDSVMVTHLDSADKRARVTGLARQSFQTIAMSSQTSRTINRALRSSKGLKVDYVLCPSFIEERPRVVIGLFYRIYGDGRKREQLILKLTQVVGADNVEYLVLGSGWGETVQSLRNLGSAVVWKDTFDPGIYRDWLHRADFALFTGLDEGAVGFLDALAVGTRVIVPPIGYHLDYRHELVTYARNVTEMANAVSSEISSRQRGFGMVGGHNWTRYAIEHIAIWERALGAAR